MKSGLVFVSALLILALVANYGIVGVFMLIGALLILWGLYMALSRYIKHLRALRYHARLTEPIIITAEYPGDPNLYRKQKYHEKYIRLSGNKNHVVGIDAQGEEIKEPVKVHAIFKDFPAENYGESWEEYQLRAQEERIRILRAFHSYLYNQGRHEWYLDKVLNQKIK